jgi:hypothetical protein
MKWISVKERLPEIGTSVIVNDGKSDWYNISWRYDRNKDARDRAKTRKDKYPEEIGWYTSCCCNQFSSSEIVYWTEIQPPKGDE